MCGILALVAWLVGCGQSDAMAVATWTLEAPRSSEQVTITLPVHLDARLPKEASRYVLRTRVELTPAMRAHALTFAIPRLAAPATLRVNGQVVRPIDPPRHIYRGEDAVRWGIPPDRSDADALDLELTIEHRWTQSAWLDTVPRLSATEEGDAEFLRIRTFNNVTADMGLATAILVAFAYVLIFILHRQRTAHGWFGLEGVAGGGYPLFSAGLTAMMLGVYDVPVMAVMVAIAAIASVYFTHAQFRLGPPSRWFVATWAVGVLAIAIGSNPFVSTRVCAIVVVVLVTVAISYHFIVMSRLVRLRPRPMNAVLVLGSWGILAVLGSVDFVAWLGFGELLGGFRCASLAISLIALLHSGALSREHFVSQKKADELNTELVARVGLLEARNREVARLNEELRHQISSRSQDLVEALSRSPDATSDTRLVPGLVVDQRYRVVRELGTGGMGAVYEVERTSDAKRLALKVLTEVAGRTGLARFAREAQLASQLTHPNVVAVFDVDVTATGTLFIVMEYVDGPSLADSVARYGDRAWALDVLSQVASGLDAIHSRGIVHRDLKPANVLLASDPARPGSPLVKIADFGISTLVDGANGAIELADTLNPEIAVAPTLSRVKLTNTGALLGTPLYMAPELARGGSSAAPAVDLFSFGVIAFELLVGETPHVEPALLARLRGRSVPPPASFVTRCPGLDDAIAECLDRCISSAPAARPTAAEVAALLKGPPMAGGAAVSARAAGRA